MLYFYILGIWNLQEKYMRFEYLRILAKDDDDAYVVGGREATKLGWLPMKFPETGNDFVIPGIEL